MNIYSNILKLIFFRNGESEPLVYATSPTEVASSLWSEDKRVPDILSDLNKVVLILKKQIFLEFRIIIF